MLKFCAFYNWDLRKLIQVQNISTVSDLRISDIFNNLNYRTMFEGIVISFDITGKSYIIEVWNIYRNVRDTYCIQEIMYKYWIGIFPEPD